MKMKKVTAILLTAMMSFGLMACGAPAAEETPAAEANTEDTQGADAEETQEAETTEETEQTDSKDAYKIMLTSFDQSVFPGLQFNGVKDACEELGMEAIVQSPATYPDLAAQIQIIETAIADGVDAILVHPVDSEGICETLQKAADNGVAVFIVDTQVADQKGTIGFFGSNNYNLGVTAAKELAASMDDKGQVAVLAGNEAALAHSLRRDGFIETMEADYPDIEIVDIQYDNVDALKANQMASAFVLSYPDLQGMFCTGEVGLSGILSAVSEGNADGKYKIVGLDSGQTTNDAIRNGLIVGSVMQSPYQMGYMSAKAAYEYLSEGKEPAEYVNDTGSLFVTSENIETQDAQNVMYE